MVLGNAVLRVWEAWGGCLRRLVRARGLAFALDYMHAEDEQTNYVCIGPVNKVHANPHPRRRSLHRPFRRAPPQLTHAVLSTYAGRCSTCSWHITPAPAPPTLPPSRSTSCGCLTIYGSRRMA